MAYGHSLTVARFGILCLPRRKGREERLCVSLKPEKEKWSRSHATKCRCQRQYVSAPGKNSQDHICSLLLANFLHNEPPFLILPMKKYVSKANENVLRKLEISKGALIHDCKSWRAILPAAKKNI